MWWAIVTLTTVGYGDYSPATVAGRWVAVFVMAGGIGDGRDPDRHPGRRDPRGQDP